MITYCTNIHPGEGWDKTFRNLRAYLPVVASAVSPNTPFPIGLRLSRRSAMELDEKTLEVFSRWLQWHNFFIPTINGFPYGAFHRTCVKEQVYLPDWRQHERVDYTMRLATLLDQWLPDGIRGSISTVPVCFGKKLPQEEFALVRKNLLLVLEHLDRLRQRSGRKVVLALEPEPGCLLETTPDVIQFFERLELPETLRPGLGICLDCCHQAVEFEEPAGPLQSLSEAGIAIGKVQVSSALRLIDPDRPLLERFRDPTYLHQVVVRDSAGVLRRYDDLPDALEKNPGQLSGEWRVHFHLPVFMEGLPECGTTRSYLEELLPLVDDAALFEVETYTWEVLPPELRTGSVTDSIIRELHWLKGQLNETNRRP